MTGTAHYPPSASTHPESRGGAKGTAHYPPSAPTHQKRRPSNKRLNTGLPDRLVSPSEDDRLEAESYGQGQVTGRLWTAKDSGKEVRRHVVTTPPTETTSSTASSCRTDQG